VTPLRQRMLEEMQTRNFSPHTIAQYVRRVSQFARHFNRSPDQLTFDDVRAYLVHLTKQGASWGVRVQTLSALRFLYVTTLGWDWNFRLLPYPRRERKLPDVPDQEVVLRFLGSIRNIKHRALLTTCYAAGLRVSEVRMLRIEDIDSRRKTIHVRLGKGRKDRMVVLSDVLLELLRAYWRIVRPTDWLFPSNANGGPLTSRSVCRVCAQTCKREGIKPKITPQTLRHSFATHLMEGGANVRAIQFLLGHRSLRTTADYMRISTDAVLAVKSPLDRAQAPS
jgi:integrase/recombinase XerD